jgi:hypothetical protein
VGDEFYFTLSFGNLGPGDAFNVVVDGSLTSACSYRDGDPFPIDVGTLACVGPFCASGVRQIYVQAEAEGSCRLSADISSSNGLPDSDAHSVPVAAPEPPAAFSLGDPELESLGPQPSPTVTATASPTVTPTASSTYTLVPTATLTIQPSPTPTFTATSTPLPTYTATFAPSPMPLASVTPTVTPEPVQGDDPSTTTTVPTPTDETAAEESVGETTPTPESVGFQGGWLMAGPELDPLMANRQLPWDPISWLRWLLARMGMVEQNVLAQVGAR